MGFVGLGGQGGGHLFGGAWTYLPGGYLGRDDVQVLGVCDVQRKRAEEGKARVEQHYAEKFGQGTYQGCGAYWDIRDMLLRDDIDAVLIAAAYHAAATNAILAVRAGKDVYCEKPTSVTIRAGRAIVEAVRAHGRVYQGGTQQRSEYDGRFRRAVELVRGGRIGQLKRVYAYQTGGGLTPPPSTARGGAVPPDVNWEAYVNCLPWFNYDGNTGAHRFAFGDINWGQHHYDIVQWGVGADDTGPVEIRLEDGKPVFRYANGVEVFGCPPPGSEWDEGGACFVGTRREDHRPPRQVLLRSARDRQGNARHEPYRRLLFDEPLGQFPGVRPHPAANDLRRGDRAPRGEHAAAGRNRHAPGPHAQVGPAERRVSRRARRQPPAVDGRPRALAVLRLAPRAVRDWGRG